MRQRKEMLRKHLDAIETAEMSRAQEGAINLARAREVPSRWGEPSPIDC